MKLLGLDTGERRTGVSFYDPAIGFVIPLDTCTHTSVEELVAHVVDVAHVRGAEHIVIGLPLLLSGAEGSQAAFARSIGRLLEQSGLSVSYLDERFTTQQKLTSDGDAAAACSVLNTYVERGVDK